MGVHMPTRCLCCNFDRVPSVVSHTEKPPQVCPNCSKHFGDWEKRDRAHVEEWRKFLDRTVDGHAVRLSTAQEQIAKLEQQVRERDTRIEEFVASALEDYSTRPIGDLQQFLQSEVVRDAERKRESAFRVRGRAMRAIWHLDELHRGAGDGKMCECGRPTRECKEFAAVEPVREELYEWERRQIERVKAGKMHELPDRHPEVRKHGGTAWGARQGWR